jgi:hypothetical protein
VAPWIGTEQSCRKGNRPNGQASRKTLQINAFHVPPKPGFFKKLVIPESVESDWQVRIINHLQRRLRMGFLKGFPAPRAHPERQVS